MIDTTTATQNSCQRKLVSDPQDIHGNLTNPRQHEGATQMPPNQDGNKQERCIQTVEPRQSIEHPFTARIAKLVPGDQRDECVTNSHSEHDRPSERIAIVPPGHPCRHDITCSKPSQDHDESRAERTYVLNETPGKGLPHQPHPTKSGIGKGMHPFQSSDLRGIPLGK